MIRVLLGPIILCTIVLGIARLVDKARAGPGAGEALVCSRRADELVIGSVAANLSPLGHGGLRTVMRLGAAVLKLGACKSAAGSNADRMGQGPGRRRCRSPCG
jgi:Na+/H+-dicarboxylate symporter